MRTGLLIHNSSNYEELQLNTRLQVCAAKFYLDRTYTVYSLYLPHIEINNTGNHKTYYPIISTIYNHGRHECEKSHMGSHNEK